MSYTILCTFGIILNNLRGKITKCTGLKGGVGGGNVDIVAICEVQYKVSVFCFHLSVVS
jgi:hypothetical protein